MAKAFVKKPFYEPLISFFMRAGKKSRQFKISSYTYYITRYGFIIIVLLTSCKKSELKSMQFDSPDEIMETQPPVQSAVAVEVNSAIRCFYSAVPVHYKESNKKYPLLIFLHGAGQIGSGIVDLPLVLNDGVAQLISLKKFPPKFTVNGENFSFIILSPQLGYLPTTLAVAEFIDYAVRTYRIDTTRIYMSGLSMGGIVTSLMGGEYASRLAAIVPISGVSCDSTICKNIAVGKLPVWAFHNRQDPVSNFNAAENFISLIRGFNPSVTPKLTAFEATTHDAWTSAINPQYKENGMNMYEWMLQYTR